MNYGSVPADADLSVDTVDVSRSLFNDTVVENVIAMPVVPFDAHIRSYVRGRLTSVITSLPPSCFTKLLTAPAASEDGHCHQRSRAYDTFTHFNAWRDFCFSGPFIHVGGHCNRCSPSYDGCMDRLRTGSDHERQQWHPRADWKLPDCAVDTTYPWGICLETVAKAFCMFSVPLPMIWWHNGSSLWPNSRALMNRNVLFMLAVGAAHR